MTTCEAVGCTNDVPISRGTKARRYCSDACRKRVERSQARAEALNAPVGSVADAVTALLDVLDLKPGSYEATLGALAVAEGRLVDAGNSNAAPAVAQTLEKLDERLGLTPSDRGDWFSLLDVELAITREGVDPDSAIGQALQRAGKTELLSFYSPPDFPPGWRGTALDGDPEEYAVEHAGDYAGPRSSLGFWHTTTQTGPLD